MYPPSWVCKKLYEIHPQLRLAWCGKEKDVVGELNPGSFAVVQLYHISDMGEVDDPIHGREHWYISLGHNDHGKAVHIKRDRGPIFNKNGGTSRDWDPLFRHPIFVCTLDSSYTDIRGEPLSTEKVFNGEFLDTIKYWLTPVVRRVKEERRATARDAERMAEDVGGEMADFLWTEARNGDGTRPAMTASDALTDYKKYVGKKRQGWGRSRSTFNSVYGLED